ncbi:MAG: flagellar export chaperone FliS [Pseudomonadota bacterium]
MYATTQQASRAYSSSAAEHVTDTADGYTLIRSLLSKLVARLGLAKHSMQAGDVATKGEQIGKAIETVNLLQVAIDESHDASLAGNLMSLYDYMSRQLLKANLQNDVGVLDEVIDLVREIKSAWDSIGENPNG